MPPVTRYFEVTFFISLIPKGDNSTREIFKMAGMDDFGYERTAILTMEFPDEEAAKKASLQDVDKLLRLAQAEAKTENLTMKKIVEVLGPKGE